MRKDRRLPCSALVAALARNGWASSLYRRAAAACTSGGDCVDWESVLAICHALGPTALRARTVMIKTSASLFASQLARALALTALIALPLGGGRAESLTDIQKRLDVAMTKASVQFHLDLGSDVHDDTEDESRNATIGQDGTLTVSGIHTHTVELNNRQILGEKLSSVERARLADLFEDARPLSGPRGIFDETGGKGSPMAYGVALTCRDHPCWSASSARQRYLRDATLGPEEPDAAQSPVSEVRVWFQDQPSAQQFAVVMSQVLPPQPAAIAGKMDLECDFHPVTRPGEQIVQRFTLDPQTNSAEVDLSTATLERRNGDVVVIKDFGGGVIMTYALNPRDWRYEGTRTLNGTADKQPVFEGQCQIAERRF